MKVGINRFNGERKKYRFFSSRENNPLFTFLSTEKKLTCDQQSRKSDVTQVSLKGTFWIKTI